VVSGKQPSPNFEDGYRIARIADAIIESGEKGTWIEVAA
jgi:predicted dehydrogenase